jgi:5'-nucleotidase
MRILLTNDDGIHAAGLWALYRELCRGHGVTVIAPDRERSAVGHGITLHHPLRAERVSVADGLEGYAISGTPADCVKLALGALMPQRPDMVIAGINAGANVGVNLNYSGTVAAAKEGALAGVASMAVSLQGTGDGLLDDAARFVARLAAIIMHRGLPTGTFLNVNLPDRPTALAAGVRVRRMGLDPGAERFDRRLDPRNRSYWWQGRDALHRPPAADTDHAALAADYITITPVRCDMTDYDLLDAISEWEGDLSA